MKLTVRLDQVELVSGTASPKKSSQNLGSRNRPTLPASAPLAAPAPPRTEDVTLDLRGQRVEAGLEQLDGFIDVLLRRGESVGFVLHGHGTGAMKEAVRSHLRSLDLVSESRPAERDEGGDAFTIFWLRD
jgi:DNA mismatch repair protein MutS2